MTLFKPQETGETRPSTLAAESARRAAPAASATLIPFPGAEARRTCRIPRSDERRGEILLFLGVRYERLAS
ncbi:MULTISPECIES: hypothetical protein [Methylobacterium]|jgi:hypothetical protein|uniref:Uncharacterized protein n=1 Tax=Methylobacterium radiotolerans (strain ATCC 27329 / DSM 1819 / JCM 2831 / NBRC 15690 / NCIMB 10815 / 0-1) TaxID=426355 RepID=B1LYQ7_METRJ|nr:MULTISPECIES: hypothetical protein [Methylobacterium]ACB22884.1 hypothetical protein Mrad2831_0874 [Methylobacterium radiotolerans JCM 2831]KIU36756.1 hypothetical protein SR39_04655 [Methylobacterium radiotolerans]KTS02050.1 hypothetical protein SB3_29385 [Methylobacterium radiotolerans]KTS44891.1 hypothetical protein SB2_22815 [Methylobacterium radiotolerans]MDE3745276.1 hypothetical protein [Methylobacterium radiotolerans]